AGEYGGRAPVGNLMLDEVFGAEVRFLEAPDSYSAAALAEANRIADDLRREGRTPYLTEVGGLSEPLSDVGYFTGGQELLEQCRSIGVEPRSVLLATRSGRTPPRPLLRPRADRPAGPPPALPPLPGAPP